MSENFKITLIAVLAAMALLIFTDVRATHYHKDHDMSVWMTFGECQIFLHDEHPDVVRVICDGLAGDNDGYDVPKLSIK